MAEKLAQISATLKKPVEFRVIGRQRVNDGLHQIRNISKEWNFSLSETGELSTQSISIELQSCDLGLCTTPYDVLGKSGATAAMLEHGLPVIGFDDGDTPKEKLFILHDHSCFLMTKIIKQKKPQNNSNNLRICLNNQPN